MAPALVCHAWLRALCGGLAAGHAGAEVVLGHGFLHGLVVHTPVHAVRSHCTPYLVTTSWLLSLERELRHGEVGANFAPWILFCLFKPNLMQKCKLQLLNKSRPPGR